MTGKLPYLRATCSSDCAFSRCCQSGVRSPGRRRGISSERARVLAEARAEERGVAHLGDDEILDLARVDHAAPRSAAARPTRGSAARSRRPTRSTAPRHRAPRAGARRSPSPTARARVRRTARGCRRASRRSRRGSARRRSCGRTGRRPSRRAARAGTCSRLRAARSSRWYSSRSRVERLRRPSAPTSSRDAAPIFWPSSNGRPTPSPFQNGTAPGTPGAGETSTRSRVISSIRQVEAPSRNVWPGARLVDHLLVELADAAAAVDEEDAEEAAVGDRARVRDGEPAGAVARADRRRRCGPRRCAAAARRTRRTGSGRRACRARSRAARARGPERIGARDERVQVVDARSPRRRRSRRSAARARRAGCAGSRVSSISPPRIARATTARLEQVGAELREDAPLRHRAELVPGAADALQAARDRLRRLDLDHEVDRAHVDAELEARRRDEARDAARLQILLDEHALLARERAVVARDLASCSSLRFASSFRRSASRSASRRLLTKTIVERCSSTSRRISG